MLRRRRPSEREIAFSFDSFLDVVTNVVGILRLILVAWVGAKAYKGPALPPLPELPTIAELADLPEPEDPLAKELARQRRELTDVQAELARQVEQWQKARQVKEPTTEELAALRTRHDQVEDRRQALERAAGDQERRAGILALSLAEIQERGRKLTEEIEALRKAPPAKQTLRYRTPISRPLQTEELLFELRHGRIAFIDIGTMLDEIRHGLREKADALKSQWEVAETTQPAGAFQLRYQLERERELGDGLTPGAGPVDRTRFRVGLAGWEVQPISDDRGETACDALRPGSAFRRVLESIDPHQTAITFCVYPDSFPLYRQLRDYLHEHDVVVAGRPLPEGVPIASSRHGTASRGQ